MYYQRLQGKCTKERVKRETQQDQDQEGKSHENCRN